MTDHVHTIPVDPSLSIEEAWKELCIFGQRVTFTGQESWTNVMCDGEECHNLEQSDAG